MQNSTPSGWPTQPPPYPVYPNPALMKGPESGRAVVLGILNIFFGYVYLMVVVLMLLGNANYLPTNGLAALLYLGIGWTAVGLFVGGILLLRRSSSGIGMTKSAFWVLLVTLGVNMVYSISQIPSRYVGQIVFAYLVLAILFLFYPLVAMLVINKRPEELGL